MNILFVFDMPIYSLNGGVERITTTLSKKFIEEGHLVVYLARFRRKIENQELNCISQFYFPDEDLYSSKNVNFYHSFILRNKFDVIINQNGAEESSYLYCNVPDNFSGRLISVNHTYPLLGLNCQPYVLFNFLGSINIYSIIKYCIKGIAYPLRIYLNKILIRKRLFKLYTYIFEKSDNVILLSSHFINDLSLFCPVLDKTKMIGIPNMSKSETHDSNIVKLKQVIYVGRFTIAEKRPDRIIKIWEKIFKQFPDWELLIVGGDNDEYLKYMHRYISCRKIERIKFKGKCDPQQYYESASILCLVSNYEGFGLVLTEAMQNHIVPLAFSSYSAVYDIINDGIDGFLVPPFDLDVYAEKLSLLMKDDNLRSVMSDSAYQSVQKFNYENIIPLWDNILIKND